MKYLIAILFVLSGCSGDKPGPVPAPKDRTFTFTIDNVEVKDGIAPTAEAVAVEKAKIETIIKLSKGKK
jgi:hypothetical protein